MAKSEMRYRVKILLYEIEPVIWRTLSVPGSMTFENFHKVIQKAMGWEDKELHEFRYGKGKNLIDVIATPHDDIVAGGKFDDERKFTLDDFLTRRRVPVRMLYRYDFLEDWVHELTFEAKEDILNMPSTREKILDAAWDLFAEEGFEAVSIRDVTNAADVNLSSVSYHFNGKNGLVDEIVEKAFVPLNIHRIRLLKEAGEEVGNVEDVSLTKIVECFVRPALRPDEYGGDIKMVTQLVARYLINPNAVIPKSLMDTIDSVYKIFSIAICSQCPELDAKKALRNLYYSMGAAFLYHSFAWLVDENCTKDRGEQMDEYLDDVVDFCVKGFKKD